MSTQPSGGVKIDNLIILQHYKSMDDFARHHKLQHLPKPRDTWRLLQMPVLGGLNGLENTFRGIAYATNGIIVAIETSAHVILFAHLQWFVKDDPEQESDIDAAMLAIGAAGVNKKLRTVDAFDGLFIDEV